MTHIRRLFLLHKLCRPVDGEGSDLGGAPSPAPDAGTESAPTPTTSEPAPSPESGAVVGDVSKPTTMLEAMSAAIDPGAQPRDPMGRFAPKSGEPGAPAAQGQPAALGADGKPIEKPAQPATAEDITAMPEGLTPKAQERFQKLANSNKELTEWRAQAEPLARAGEYVQEAFQTNQVQPEQFETFLKFVGALNKGDLATAQQVIQAEMQAIAQLTGQEFSIDPLTQHPDLLEAVNGFQMTRQAAQETARYRFAENARQQAANQQQEAQQSQRAAQQAVGQAQQQIDQFCKQMQTSDLDYAKVEPMLLDAIKGGLLEGIPPQQWGAMVQRQYQMIKKVAASQRTLEPATQVLRPTGVPSPGQAPKNMMEAMFNRG